MAQRSILSLLYFVVSRVVRRAGSLQPTGLLNVLHTAVPPHILPADRLRLLAEIEATVVVHGRLFPQIVETPRLPSERYVFLLVHLTVWQVRKRQSGVRLCQVLHNRVASGRTLQHRSATFNSAQDKAQCQKVPGGNRQWLGIEV